MESLGKVVEGVRYLLWVDAGLLEELFDDGVDDLLSLVHGTLQRGVDGTVLHGNDACTWQHMQRQRMDWAAIVALTSRTFQGKNGPSKNDPGLPSERPVSSPRPERSMIFCWKMTFSSLKHCKQRATFLSLTHREY